MWRSFFLKKSFLYILNIRRGVSGRKPKVSRGGGSSRHIASGKAATCRGRMPVFNDPNGSQCSVCGLSSITASAYQAQAVLVRLAWSLVRTWSSARVDRGLDNVRVLWEGDRRGLRFEKSLHSSMCWLFEQYLAWSGAIASRAVGDATAALVGGQSRQLGLLEVEVGPAPLELHWGSFKWGSCPSRDVLGPKGSSRSLAQQQPTSMRPHHAPAVLRRINASHIHMEQQTL